jgi:hypothetical protein
MSIAFDAAYSNSLGCEVSHNRDGKPGCRERRDFLYPLEQGALEPALCTIEGCLAFGHSGKGGPRRSLIRANVCTHPDKPMVDGLGRSPRIVPA